mgnify:CR=1 FL=1
MTLSALALPFPPSFAFPCFYSRGHAERVFVEPFEVGFRWFVVSCPSAAPFLSGSSFAA